MFGEGLYPGGCGRLCAETQQKGNTVLAIPTPAPQAIEGYHPPWNGGGVLILQPWAASERGEPHESRECRDRRRRQQRRAVPDLHYDATLSASGCSSTTGASKKTIKPSATHIIISFQNKIATGQRDRRERDLRKDQSHARTTQSKDGLKIEFDKDWNCTCARPTQSPLSVFTRKARMRPRQTTLHARSCKEFAPFL